MRSSAKGIPSSAPEDNNNKKAFRSYRRRLGSERDTTQTRERRPHARFENREQGQTNDSSQDGIE